METQCSIHFSISSLSEERQLVSLLYQNRAAANGQALSLPHDSICQKKIITNHAWLGFIGHSCVESSIISSSLFLYHFCWDPSAKWSFGDGDSFQVIYGIFKPASFNVLKERRWCSRSVQDLTAHWEAPPEQVDWGTPAAGEVNS